MTAPVLAIPGFESRNLDLVAVVDESTSITYRELLRRVNAVRVGLAKRGISPGSPIAIAMGRSVNYIAAMLGAWSAGCYFVPLSARDSKDRIANLVARAGCDVVLYENIVEDLLNVADAFAGDTSGWQTPEVAYGIFTSGTTAQPKLVRIALRSLLHYVRAISDRLEVAPEWRYAYVSPFTADLGYTGLFASLANLGTLHIISDEVARSGSLFERYVQDHCIDFLKITPSHFRALWSSASDRRGVGPGKRLVFGGEQLGKDLVETVVRDAGECRIFNHYGPTEATIGAVAFEIRRDIIPSPIPIGTPLGEMRAFVLDDTLTSVSEGKVGQLHLAGPGLSLDVAHSQGYDAATHRKVDAAVPAMYATGDLVSRDASGILTYVGRIDDQIKINGHRVMPQLLEQDWQRHLNMVLAIVPFENGGAMHLGAVIETTDRSKNLESSVRQRLSEAFLGWEVPSVIRLVERLPLTSNGKVDRAGLLCEIARPDGAQETSNRLIVEQLGAVERDVLHLVESVLPRKPLNLEAGVVENGAHSLVVLKVVARVKQVFSVIIRPDECYAASTVRALVVDIASRIGAAGGPGPQQAQVDRSPVPVHEVGFLPPNEPATVLCILSLEGDIDPLRVRKALHKVIQDNEVFRLDFFKTDGGWFMQPHPEVKLDFEVCTSFQSDDRDRQVNDFIDGLRAHVFSIERGPLMTFKLLRLGAKSWIFGMRNVHILMDSVGRSIFFEQLSKAYREETASRPAAMQTDYLGVVKQYQAWLASDQARAETAYWARDLYGVPPAPRALYPEQPPASNEPRELMREFSESESAALSAVAMASGITLFELYFGLFMCSYSDAAEVSEVTCPITSSIRDWFTEPVIGLLGNRLYVRARFSDAAPRCTEDIRVVIDALRRARLHAKLHYTKMEEGLSAADLKSLQSCNHIGFHSLYNSASGLSLDGVEVGSVDVPIGRLSRVNFYMNFTARNHILKVVCPAQFSFAFIRRLFGDLISRTQNLAENQLSISPIAAPASGAAEPGR